MAVKSSNQLTIIDITDAYSVTLTTDSYVFPGTTTAAIAGSVSTQVNAMRGDENIAASVVLSEIEKPTGVSVTSDNDATSPTLTISVTGSVTEGGVVEIPVHIGDVTITKNFTFAIAFKGNTGAQGAAGTSVTVESTEVKYAVSDNTTQPSSWQDTIPTAAAGKYLWTRTVVTYSDGKSTTTYSYAKQGEKGETGAQGAAGTSVSVESTEVKYGVSTSASTQPTTWQDTIPTAAAGQYLWTKTVVTYSDGDSTTTYSYAKQGEKGEKGEQGDKGDKGDDAITIDITSSNGTIFKNAAIATVLTAHVYKGGAEVTGSALTALGTIKWYKDGGTTSVATGATLTITAGDVTNKATYIAQLEG